MKDEVVAFIRKHQLLKPMATVLVAVSGGPDSMALLHFFKTIQQEFSLRVIALSVDHQLRGEESKEDMEYVGEMCQKWGIEFAGTSIDVKHYKKQEHIGTQLAARIVRYRFFEEKMHAYHADYLAFGHHGDDQAETILMHMVRSADSSALSGIPVKREFAGGQIIRPFLCVTKEILEAYCKEHGIIPRLDPSNEGTDYTRNFYRKNVIPLLKEKNPNLHTTMQHLSESLHEDEAYLQQEARKMVEELVVLEKNPTRATFEIKDFTERASALQRRAYHLILSYLYEELPKDLSYVHEEHFFSLLKQDKGTVQIDFPRHLKVEKAYNKLIFYFQANEETDTTFQVEIPIPGKVRLPDGGVLIASYTNEVPDQTKHTYIFLENKVEMPLYVRTRQDGDRMSWSGLNGSRKVKDIFIDAKVPLPKRNTWPIVTDGNGEIIWLVGLKKRDSIPTEKRSLWIQLEYQQDTM